MKKVVCDKVCNNCGTVMFKVTADDTYGTITEEIDSFSTKYINKPLIKISDKRILCVDCARQSLKLHYINKYS